MAESMGYIKVIEASGAKIAADTCPVVAPIGGRFEVMATDSAKNCYYAAARHGFQTVYKSFEQVVAEALQ
jgi:predicted aconitase